MNVLKSLAPCLIVLGLVLAVVGALVDRRRHRPGRGPDSGGWSGGEMAGGWAADGGGCDAGDGGGGDC